MKRNLSLTGFIFILIAVMTRIVMATRENNSCRDGFHLNYTIPMFEICPQRPVMFGEDAEMWQTIPKMIPAVLPGLGCWSQHKTRMSGQRICRIPDCHSNPCENGWCEETMVGFRCHSPEEQSATLPRFTLTPSQHGGSSPNVTSTPSDPAATSIEPQTTRLTTFPRFTLTTMTPSQHGGTSPNITSTPSDPVVTSIEPQTSQTTTATSSTIKSRSSAPPMTTTHEPRTSQPSLNACDYEPCRNGGTCSSSAPSVYNCTCNAGHKGTHCEFSICPDGWFYYGSKCYLLLPQSTEWFPAKQACRAMAVRFNGGAGTGQTSMLFPESQEEAEEMAQRFAGADGAGRIWINCNDMQKEGEWICEKDANGTISTYRNWYTTEPNGNGDTAYLMNYTNHADWRLYDVKWFDFNDHTTAPIPQTLCQVVL